MILESERIREVGIEKNISGLKSVDYKNIFDSANVALWIEDASLLKSEIEAIRKRGVYNFRTYLTRNPAELHRLIDLIRVVDVNEKALALYQVKSKTQIEKGIRSLLHNESFGHVREELLSFIEGGSTYEYESEKRTFHGELIATHIKTVIPQESLETWNLWFVTINDISDKRRLEKKMFEQQVEFDSVTLFRNKQLSAVSHDVRNQLGNLLGFSEILIERFYEMSDTKKLDYIRLMNQITKQTHELLHNLLNWTRIKEDKFLLDKTEFRFADLFEESEYQLSYLLQAKNISVKLYDEQNMLLFADYNILSFVVRNILGNAVKFSKANSHIEVLVGKASGKVVIVVKDFGVGMSEEEIAGIYNNTPAAKNTVNESSSKGAGLGLILCRDFIKLHGGSISVKSEKEIGTTFTILIPER